MQAARTVSEDVRRAIIQLHPPSILGSPPSAKPTVFSTIGDISSTLGGDRV